MGRRAKSSPKAAPTPPDLLGKNKRCTSCGEWLNKTRGFYSSRSPLFAVDGRVNICKDCFIKHSLTEKGEVDTVKFQQMLRQIDKPFYKDCLVMAGNEILRATPTMKKEELNLHGEEIIRLYMKNISTLKQYANKDYAASEREHFIYSRRVMDKPESKALLNQSTNSAYEIIIEDMDDDFEVTQEMLDLFGDGFTSVEYKKMYDKYQKLKLNYTLQTNLHQEALATYVRFKVKEETATAAGDVDDAKKWYDAAQNAADKGKLTPKQLTQADLHGGINSFSELFKAVEQAVDVIPILPQFKYRPNDACDFIIWCYVNYERDLHGLPLCKYEDVYKFYDERKREYIEQYGDPYGIFTEDTTENVRPAIKQFIDLPTEYKSSDGESSDGDDV